MFTKLVILALCVLCVSGHQWNQRRYETVLKKGMSQTPMTARQDVNIRSGQCSGVYYTDSLCSSNVDLSSVKVTVTDGQPYPDITISNQLSVVKITRQSVLGYCFDAARIVIEGSCPVLVAGQSQN